MGRVVKYEACPVCRQNGRDNTGDNLVRYDDDSAFCFACRYVEPASILKYIGNQLNESKTNGSTSKILPASFTREVPARAWEWLFQYGLGYTYWKKYCGFAPEENRLIFTVGDPVAFSIGRFIPPCTPGASTTGHDVEAGREDGRVVHGDKAPRKWYAYGEPHTHCEVLHPDSGPGRTVVLVEDIVSAHKVGRITTAIPLFGTEIHKPHLYYLMNQDKPIKIWLDKDQEYRVNKIAMRLQSLVDVPVSCIVTDEDPKKQSFDLIESAI